MYHCLIVGHVAIVNDISPNNIHCLIAGKVKASNVLLYDNICIVGHVAIVNDY